MANGVNADADTKDKTTDVVDGKDATTDVDAKGGADTPPTYTKEAYDTVKNESIKRKVKLDSLTGELVTIKATNADLLKKVKKLTEIISGDEPADADVNTDEIFAQFKKNQDETHGIMRSILVKSSFIQAASKMTNKFHDPEFVYGTISRDDSRLNVSLEAQHVSGMDDIVNEIAKKQPYLLVPSKADGDDKTDDTAADSVSAPGAKPPKNQPVDSTNKDKVKEIMKKAEEIGGMEGSTYYSNEMEKLRAK
ncbi:MAG: hypothetical protein KAJ19_05110 [Gammaproteobacteria bacterium]|nr:hypothetical protein [Gammaproteobacteria bacterium]